ncbi:MAG: hypothetical protein ACXVCY_08000 [Pseudobdellovibrionaceae bacterium]
MRFISTIVILCSILSAHLNAFAQDNGAVDRCLKALVTPEFGTNPKAFAARDSISITVNHRLYVWSGTSIYAIPSKSIRGQQGYITAAQQAIKSGKEVWNSEHGRLDEKIPSEDLLRVKKLFIQESGYFQRNAVMKASERRNFHGLAEAYDACSDLRDIKTADDPKMTIAQRAQLVLERMRPNTPLASDKKERPNGKR